MMLMLYLVKNAYKQSQVLRPFLSRLEKKIQKYAFTGSSGSRPIPS